MPVVQITFDTETLGDPKAAACLGPVKVPKNYSKPETIDAFLEDAEVKRRDGLSLHPHSCTLAALALQVGDGEPWCHVVKSEDDERDVLTEFRDIYQSHRDVQLITFNGFRFDHLVLMFRAIKLQVPKFPHLSADRFHSPHIDLWARLSEKGVVAAHALRYYCLYLGVPYADDISGKDIAGLAADGKWDDIRTHCLSDVVATYGLAKRLNLVR